MTVAQEILYNEFMNTLEEFTALTGIPTSYENQGSNGKYLFFETSDNDGAGFYIEINSYLDGLRTLENMKDGYILAKKGKFL